MDRQGNRLVDLDAEWTLIYRKGTAEVSFPLAIGRLHVTPRLRYGWENLSLLQLSYSLGGDEGFPGLHIGERRGDRETYASTLLSPIAVSGRCWRGSSSRQARQRVAAISSRAATGSRARARGSG